ncbi:MAG: sugar ABC transporter permease [Clostridiales bacterium]|jgi:multiple sugar transport system permease protein|nr:sugar ABC transporter permease [Clostridiales bacterium]
MTNHQKPRGLTDPQAGFLLVIPGLAVFLAIIAYPFLNSVFMSFTDRNMMRQVWGFVGFENYVKVFKDIYFLDTLKNTAIFVVCATVLPFCLGLAWAVVLNQGFKGSEILRGVTLVNWIIPGTAIGFLWMWIFNGEYGVLNGILSSFGVKVNWLGAKGTAMMVVIIARTWQMLPWYMSFLLGGLQSVSLDVVEAARIDGANNWQAFTKVILPSMASIATVVLVLGIIGNLQHFDLPWVMVEGGPARATTTFSIEVYRTAFKNWNLGKAATIGTIWAVLLACFSFLYLKSIDRQDTD